MIFFTMTLMCAVVTAMCLLAVELNAALSLATVDAFINLLIVLAFMFGYCYYSECVAADVLAIGEIFFNSPWYRLPVGRQKLVMLPIQRAQRTCRFRCCGLFECSMAVFSSVSGFHLLVYLSNRCRFHGTFVVEMAKISFCRMKMEKAILFFPFQCRFYKALARTSLSFAASSEINWVYGNL